MRAAVLMNTLSGGADRIAEISAAIKSFLKGYEIVSVDDYGGNVLQPDIMLQAIEGGFIPRLNAAVDAVSAYEPELYVLAGGDGIAAYVADRLLAKDPTCKPKFVGVAMGTANVGPIISFTAEELSDLTPEDLHFESCGAVEARSCGKHAAYGFNDIVLGNTLLATVDGKTCTVSAADMCRDGSKTPVDPHEHLGENLTVIKNGKELPAVRHAVSQIIVSAMERERLYGRAVTGVLCLTDGNEEKGAMTLTERPLVILDYDRRGYEEFAFESHILFSQKDEMEVRGLDDDVLIIADGNPIALEEGRAEMRYVPDIICIGKK